MQQKEVATEIYYMEKLKKNRKLNHRTKYRRRAGKQGGTNSKEKNDNLSIFYYSVYSSAERFNISLLLPSLYDQDTELPTNASIASGMQITNYRSYYILKPLIVIITSLV